MAWTYDASVCFRAFKSDSVIRDYDLVRLGSRGGAFEIGSDTLLEEIDEGDEGEAILSRYEVQSRKSKLAKLAPVRDRALVLPLSRVGLKGAEAATKGARCGALFTHMYRFSA